MRDHRIRRARGRRSRCCSAGFAGSSTAATTPPASRCAKTSGLDYVRAVGNLQNLVDAAGPNGSTARHGLGHTRWATHGGVTELNAHPLTGCDASKLAIVLNGIVENYRELREQLDRRRPHVHVRDRRRSRRAPARARVRRRPRAGARCASTRSSRATSRSSRSTTTSPTCSSACATRRRSSSVSARARTSSRRTSPRSSAETRRAVFPDDGEIVEITPAGARFFRDGAEIEHPAVEELDWDDEAAEKGGYETFMLKEIYEQPEAVRETIGDRVRGHQLVLDALGLTELEVRNLRRIVIVAARHLVPRRRRRPLHHRGVGAHSGRARHRERVDLPQPGALEGHARDRHLAIGRVARHGQRGQARARARRAHARDHEHDGHADHARGRCDAVHALRASRSASPRRRRSPRRSRCSACSR